MDKEEHVGERQCLQLDAVKRRRDGGAIGEVRRCRQERVAGINPEVVITRVKERRWRSERGRRLPSGERV